MTAAEPPIGLVGFRYEFVVKPRFVTAAEKLNKITEVPVVAVKTGRSVIIFCGSAQADVAEIVAHQPVVIEHDIRIERKAVAFLLFDRPAVYAQLIKRGLYAALPYFVGYRSVLYARPVERLDILLLHGAEQGVPVVLIFLVVDGVV